MHYTTRADLREEPDPRSQDRKTWRATFELGSWLGEGSGEEEGDGQEDGGEEVVMHGLGAPELIVITLWTLLMGGIGAAIGARKARSGFGFVLGALLGPLGWLVTFVMPSNHPKCPACKGDVFTGATKCKNCGSDLPAGL